jgi:hypothetical protein
MRSPIAAVIVSVVFGLGSLTSAQQPNVERILLDTTLWGADFPALLPALQALRDTGETHAYIFTDRAAGAGALPSAEAATARVEKLRTLIVQPRALDPKFAALQKQAAARGPLRVETARLTEDDGVHVVVARPGGAQLLPAGLTIQAVRSRLGEPERVVEQVIQGRADQLPVILKLHVYAGGAIAFAESNWAEPGIVERVVADLTRVAPVIAK